MPPERSDYCRRARAGAAQQYRAVGGGGLSGGGVSVSERQGAPGRRSGAPPTPSWRKSWARSDRQAPLRRTAAHDGPAAEHGDPPTLIRPRGSRRRGVGLVIRRMRPKPPLEGEVDREADGRGDRPVSAAGWSWAAGPRRGASRSLAATAPRGRRRRRSLRAANALTALAQATPPPDMAPPPQHDTAVRSGSRSPAAVASLLCGQAPHCVRRGARSHLHYRRRCWPAPTAFTKRALGQRRRRSRRAPWASADGAHPR